MAEVFISKLVLNSGSEVTLEADDKMLIVGANNAGKSQLLRDIIFISSSDDNIFHDRSVVLKDLELNKGFTDQSLLEKIENKSDRRDQNHFFLFGVPIHHRISDSNRNKKYLPNNLYRLFMRNISADDRLISTNLQTAVDVGQDKTKPQHFMYDDETLLNKISSLFEDAFGQQLMIDFRGGSKIPFYVGKAPSGNDMVDKSGNAYVQELRKNPLLHEQGDGMRSYAGILFEALVLDYDVTLIDEPEAFLHPPQMRKLGKTLASNTNGQLLVATHSSDVVRGFLDGTGGDSRIVRIVRDGNLNKVYEASPDVVRQLWERPRLRYSNAFEALFHEQSVVCEDDSDCRLFNAVAERLVDSGSISRIPDTSYIPSGGKHAIPEIVEALRLVGVKMKAVFDIDFLSEASLVEKTIKAFGGDWRDYEIDWKRLNASVNNGVKGKTAAEVKQAIRELLDNQAADALPSVRLIAEELKQTEAWKILKRAGSAALPNGDATTTFVKLVERLEQLGIYVIREGEIENFYPEAGGHGPKFVTKVLDEVGLDSPKLEKLRNFVSRVHVGHASPLMT